MAVYRKTLQCYIMLTASFVTIKMCHIKCSCDIKYFMECDNVSISEVSVPDLVKTVVLKNFDVSTLKKGTFIKAPNWSFVNTLFIYGKFGLVLYNHSFEGLLRLKNLHFHHNHLTSLERLAFKYLHQLETLDLSETSLVLPKDVMLALKFGDLPRLRRVFLRNLGGGNLQSIQLGYNFLSSLTKSGSRNITYLDLSKMTVDLIDYRNILKFGLCNSLRTLIMRNCTFVRLDYMSSDQCKSLEVVDISGSFLPTMNLTLTDSYFMCQILKFASSVKEYFFNNIFKSNPNMVVILHHYLLDLRNCPLEIKKLSVSENTLKWLDVSVLLNNSTTESFQWVDASHNQIEYVSPSLLEALLSIKHLDLAINRLYIMQEQYPEQFERLFNSQKMLKNISMANNNLLRLPENMFRNNPDLNRIDMSNNKLTSLTFELQHLKHLRYLGLAGNKIKEIDSIARKVFDTLWMPVNATTRTFKLDLSGNEYSCSCSENNVEFIQWIQDSHAQNLTEQNETFYCFENKVKIDISKDGADELKETCQWHIMRFYMSIFLPMLFAVLVACLVFMTATIRKINLNRKTKKRLDYVAAQLRENKFPKQHLAFISFCSEDEDVVITKILPKLQKTLSQFINANKTFVARGDATFRPGFPLHDEIIKSIEEAAVIILAVSRNFCRKQWCKQEIREAYDQNKPIILIMLEKVETQLMDDILKRIFQQYTHARWVTNDDGEAFLEPDWLHFCKAVIALAGRVMCIPQNNNIVE